MGCVHRHRRRFTRPGVVGGAHAVDDLRDFIRYPYYKRPDLKKPIQTLKLKQIRPTHNGFEWAMRKRKRVYFPTLALISPFLAVSSFSTNENPPCCYPSRQWSSKARAMENPFLSNYKGKSPEISILHLDPWCFCLFSSF